MQLLRHRKNHLRQPLDLWCYMTLVEVCLPHFSYPPSLTFSSLLAKAFPRALASFALVPNTTAHSHPLTSNVMVVNKEGDLELYAVYDTPKQATWSARGDLAISAGQTCRVLEGFSESSLVQRLTQSNSNSRSREAETVLRGRPHPVANSTNVTRQRTITDPVIPSPPPAPLFGRGDEEGFPALGSGSRSGTPTHLADSREKKGSASGITLDRRAKWDNAGSVVGGESIITTATAPGTGTVTTMRGVSGVRNRRSRDGLETGVGSRTHSMSRGRRMGRGVNRIVEDDISMLMRRRALKGYGLSKVCSYFYLFHSSGTGLIHSFLDSSHKTTYRLCRMTMMHSMDSNTCWLISGLGYAVRINLSSFHNQLPD
jgi:WD repeat-containing protein mio